MLLVKWWAVLLECSEQLRIKPAISLPNNLKDIQKISEKFKMYHETSYMSYMTSVLSCQFLCSLKFHDIAKIILKKSSFFHQLLHFCFSLFLIFRSSHVCLHKTKFLAFQKVHHNTYTNPLWYQISMGCEALWMLSLRVVKDVSIAFSWFVCIILRYNGNCNFFFWNLMKNWLFYNKKILFWGQLKGTILDPAYAYLS